jgi:hypothetical protein
LELEDARIAAANCRPAVQSADSDNLSAPLAAVRVFPAAVLGRWAAINKLMSHSEDLVWNTITESAKTRFDYSAFEGVFGDTGSRNLAENVLFLVVAGYAAEH